MSTPTKAPAWSIDADVAHHLDRWLPLFEVLAPRAEVLAAIRRYAEEDR